MIGGLVLNWVAYGVYHWKRSTKIIFFSHKQEKKATKMGFIPVNIERHASAAGCKT